MKTMSVLPSLAIVLSVLSGIATGAPVNDTDATGLVGLFSIRSYRPIRSSQNPNLCIQSGSAVLTLGTCANTLAQFWGPFKDSDNIFRFQNFATVDCMWVDDAQNLQSPYMNECTLSDNSGRSVTNAQWDIGFNLPRTDDAFLKPHVGGKTANLCISPQTTLAVGATLVLRPCSGASNQKWVIGLD